LATRYLLIFALDPSFWEQTRAPFPEAQAATSSRSSLWIKSEVERGAAAQEQPPLFRQGFL